MAADFTRARHPELPPTVLPMAAVQVYPGWEAYGEPSPNPDELWAAIAAEADAEPPAAPSPTPKRGSAPAAETPAPAGAAPKE